MNRSGIAPVLIALVGLCPSGAGRAAEPVAAAPSVLLLTVDSLRPDALGWIGGGSWTPHLDRLAREGFRLGRAVSPAPLTMPAHASVFSGLVPRRHGVRDDGRVLSPGVPLLTERLEEAGYSTAAFVSGFPLAGMFGLGRGFDLYDDRLTTGEAGPGGGQALERPAAETVAGARGWLARAREPWFLWVHLNDPRFPYEPPGNLRQSGWRGAYDGEVAAVDRAVGELLRSVEIFGTERLLTVLAADHGESLGEHGEGTHGYFVYDSTLLVPMVWHAPGRVEPGAADAPARLVDVAPTILDLLGLEPLDGIDGVSLGETLEGGSQDLPPALLETRLPWNSYGWAPLTAIRDDGWKLIAAPRPELYDLSSDPAEQADLFALEPRKAGELKQALDAAMRTPIVAAGTFVAAEVAETLVALGYPATASRVAESPVGLPDPKDRLALRQLLADGAERLRQGALRPALELFDRALAEEPENRFALSRSGEALLRLGAFPEAIARLLRAVHLDPEQPEVRALLAEALQRAGRFDEAAAEWAELVRMRPDSTRAWSNLGVALGRAGRQDEAVEAMTRSAALAPGDADRLARLAFAELSAGRTGPAVWHFLQAADLAGGDFAHSGALGLLLLELRRNDQARGWLARAGPSEPEFSEARFQLAILEVEAGDGESAARSLGEALAASPGMRSRALADARLAPLLDER